MQRGILALVAVGVGGVWLSLAGLVAAADKCPSGSVRSGTICMDRYEASVWDLTEVSAAAKKKLVDRIREGRVDEADLLAVGAIQRGVSGDDYGAGCPDTGNGCVDFYAVAIPGVTPSQFLTWFQAAAAARNSWKRLPTNAEWQAAAFGTPDPGSSAVGSEDCNTANAGGAGVHAAVPTGSRSNCVSDVEAFDMVGNVWEWVADWVPLSPAGCPSAWTPMGTFSSDDFMCLSGAETTTGPGALIRGGSYGNFESAGVFAVVGQFIPSRSEPGVGFRAAR